MCLITSQTLDNKQQTSYIVHHTLDVRRVTSDILHQTWDIWNQTSVIRCLTSDITHSTSDIRRLMSDVRHLMFHILSDKFLPMYLSDVFVIFDVLPSICTFYHVLPCCFCHVLLVYRVMSWMFVYYHVNVSPRFTTFYPSRNGYRACLCRVAFFCPIFCPTFCIQLFRERLSEKMCTRQSRKATWDIINTLFLTQ